MKEFDIYLNKRLTECDIIVYSIPYRDGLTVMNRLILESCVENYTLCKFIAMQTDSELVSHIDDMLKTCIERLNWGTEFEASAKFNVLYSVYPPKVAMQISANNVKLLANSFTDANSALQITAHPLLAYVGKSAGSGESVIEIGQTADVLKNSIERFSSPMELDAEIEKTRKQSFLTAESDMVIASGITDLCYRITTTIDTSLEIAAAVLGTEIHFSLGSGTNGIVINADVGDGDYATKYLAVESTVSILAEATESLTQFMYPSETEVLMAMEASCLLKRHRLLSEMDEDALLSYDDMTLEEVDFIIL